MYVVHICSEISPLAQAGGLADVISGLSSACIKKKDHVDIILPKYDSINYSLIENLTVYIQDLYVPFGGEHVHTTVWEGNYRGLKFFLIDPHSSQHYFNRSHIYGFDDDPERFVFFSKAALTFLHESGRHPDILHLHDWATACVAPLYHELYKSQFDVGAILLNIHNLSHQGRCHPDVIELAGLKPHLYHTPNQLSDPVHPSQINLLKGGILFSDKVVAVSPTYAKEIQTREYGFHLDSILAKHSKKLEGILNGIDYADWDPAEDAYLYKKFPKTQRASSIRKAKRANKENLFERLGLEPTDGPTVAAISRIVSQKSPYLIRYAMETTLAYGGNFILVGTVGDRHYTEEFHSLQNIYRQSKNVAILLEFNHELSHQVFAAADMLVIPSRFEPCGLTQMCAMRYGTVPIVTATGGLKDTVIDANTPPSPNHTPNGFTFPEPTETSLDQALKRSITMFKEDKKSWDNLIRSGMSRTFCWDSPSNQYRILYHKTLTSKGKKHIY
ncbi:MAG: Glycogen synthase [Chlamydiia bacterium]|nr:Glycogen synthase [Chlamydiia bacterium]